MAKNLLIVESPAKAKTINKYLGKDFTVLASYGHVRDLRPKEGAVDTGQRFRDGLRDHRTQRETRRCHRQSRGQAADALYLATDLDREGEAISWHIAEILSERGLLKGKTAASRRVFRDHAARRSRKRWRIRAQLSLDLVERAAGAARAGLSGRIQSVAGVVAQGAAWIVRRPCAVAGAAHDR